MFVLVSLLSLARAPEGTAPCPVEKAMALIEAHRAADARALLEPCVAVEPGDAGVAIVLAQALLATRDEKEAVKVLERAEQRQPRNAELALWLGRAYGQRAMHASVFEQPSLATRVRKSFERAVVLDPENLEARSGLLEYYLRAPNVLGGSPARAREQAEEIGKRNPLKGVRAEGRIAEHEKRWVQADQIYENGVRDFPGRIEPILWRAALAARLHDWNRAFDLLERALAERPEDSRICFELGSVAAASGQRLERGEECLKRYLAREPGPEDPPLAEAHVRLAEIYEKRRDRGLARQQYGEALRLDPGLSQARAALARLR